MGIDIGVEINNPKNWKKTHKKQYDVYMTRPLPGAKCHNFFEDCSYVTDQNKQFILSGTCGETWVIGAEKIAKTYTFSDGTPITPDTLKSKCLGTGEIPWIKLSTKSDPVINFAFHLPLSIRNFPVQTSWGDTLLANRDGIKHGKGDFLVCASTPDGCPNINDVWVVNGEVFPRTYDMHAFPNMFTQDISASATPFPKKTFVKGGTNTGTEKVKVSKEETEANKFLGLAKNVAEAVAKCYGQTVGASIQNAGLAGKKYGLEGNYIIGTDYNFWRYKYNVAFSNGNTVQLVITAMTTSSEHDADPYISVEASNGSMRVAMMRECSEEGIMETKGKRFSALTNSDFMAVVNKLLGINNEVSSNKNSGAAKKLGKSKSIFGLFKRN